MDCASCGDELDVYASSNYDVGDIDTPLCFPCYLDSDELLHDYEEYDPSYLDDEEKEIARDALQDKLRYIVFFRVGDDPPESLVAFARNEAEVDSLQNAVQESELGQFIEETTEFDLGNVYGDLDRALCWRASEWKHSSVGLSGRPGPSQVDVIERIPCIADGYGWLQDDTKDELKDTLLEDFLDVADLESIDTLGRASSAVKEEFPVAISFGLYPPARDYFRENQHLLGKQSRKMIRNVTNGEEFERFFVDLGSEAGLEGHRGHGLWGLPEAVRDDLEEFRGKSGIPDYFVWGDRDDLVEFIRGNGLAEFEEPKHDVGVFVEVKYTSWDANREFYTDNQMKVFPQLQENGFDVLIFKGTEEDYWLERYSP